MESGEPFCADRRGAYGNSRGGAKPDCSSAGRPASATERRGHHDLIAFLGVGVGWHGTDPGDSHHRGAARDLRPHAIVEARGAMVERLTRSPASEHCTTFAKSLARVWLVD